jgi:hypothetical protein
MLRPIRSVHVVDATSFDHRLASIARALHAASSGCLNSFGKVFGYRHEGNVTLFLQLLGDSKFCVWIVRLDSMPIEIGLAKQLSRESLGNMILTCSSGLQLPALSFLANSELFLGD